MNICGISFVIPQNKPYVLKEMFQNISLNNYTWINAKEQEEIFPQSDDGLPINKIFLGKDVLNGDEFQTLIQNPHFVLFVKLLAFPSNKELKEIETYSDYLMSNCEMVVLIYDCEYVEIYTRSLEIINTITNNCVQYGYTKIELISEETRSRDNMNVG